MTGSCIYAKLVLEFGETKVQAWTQHRRLDEYAHIEARFDELTSIAMCYYSARGVEWDEAPKVEL